MKHRVVGAVLFGIGVLLLVAAAGLAFVVTPALKKLPYDLEPSKSVAEAENATFLQIRAGGDLAIERGTLRATTAVQTNRKATADLTGDLNTSAVVWTVGQTVERADSSEKISQYAAELALDRVSGAGLPNWEGRWYDESETKEKVDFQGQVYKFPFDTEKKDYPVYDRDLREAVPAQYKGTEDVEGIEAYRFEQVIADQELNLAEERVKLLLGKFAPEATTAKVIYSNTRTLWVDPITGSYLKVREEQRKSLVPDSGPQTTLLDANFQYTDATVRESVERAKSSRAQLQAIGLYLPASLALLGLIAVAGSLLVIRRGAAVPAVAAAPAARHRAESGPDADLGATRVDQPAVRDDMPTAGQAATEDKSVPAQRPAAGEVEQR